MTGRRRQNRWRGPAAVLITVIVSGALELMGLELALGGAEDGRLHPEAGAAGRHDRSSEEVGTKGDRGGAGAVGGISRSLRAALSAGQLIPLRIGYNS